MSFFRFPKKERLCGQIRINRLYESGQHFTVYPLRITYDISAQRQDAAPTSRHPEVLVWASKRYFKHAVVRNRLKRQMREAYRLHSQPLKEACEQKNIHMQIAINYIAKEILPYQAIEHATEKAIVKIGVRNQE